MTTSLQTYIAIILARGGSKRLPGKNILPLAGKPLIQYSIEQALQCEQIKEVYVSTDDAEIAKVALACNAKVLNRGEALATDTTTSGETLKGAVEQLESQGVNFDVVVLLQPTNPFRPSGLIANCIAKFEESGRDSLFTVSTLKQKFGEIVNNQFKPVNYHFEQRSQDMRPLYFENGLLYLSKKETIKQGKVFTEDAYPFIVDSIHATVDIDTKEDFEYAQYLIEKHNLED